MQMIPPELQQRYGAFLAERGIATELRPHFLKWLRYYLDFCQKYALDSADKRSFPPFDEKLKSKGQSEAYRRQARNAVAAYFRVITGEAGAAPAQTAQSGPNPAAPAATPQPPSPVARTDPAPSQRRDAQSPAVRSVASVRPSLRQEAPAVPAHDESSRNGPSGADALKPSGESWKWVYEGLDSAIKIRHYSPKTLSAYRFWTRRLQTFTRSKDARLLGTEDLRAFLSYLATAKQVSASSQNQALNALIFLYKHVLEKQFGRIEGVVKAKRRPYIPDTISAPSRKCSATATSRPP
jgi:hypothetical protein